jgi:large subunit ribosomal protein L31e
MAEEKTKPEEKKTEKKPEKKEEEKLEEKVEEKKPEVKEESKTSVADEISKDVKEASKPAVAKKSEKKESKKEQKVELEREYVIPLKRGVLKAPRYRRAKKAIRVIREFLVRHMKVRDRDLRKVKVNIDLNNEIWFRGIKKPANKIKVIAKKIDGIVYAELADIPDVVKFKRARLEKRAANVAATANAKPDKKKKEDKDKDKDGVEDKKEEAEDKKSGAVKEARDQKNLAKSQKHTSAGAHQKKTAPIRKTLK